MGYRPYLATAPEALGTTDVMTKVYGWMSLALALSAAAAVGTASDPAMLRILLGNRLVFFGLVLAELGLVLYLSAAISRMSLSAAKAVFIVYSLLNGVTVSVIFLAYTSESIGATFLVTAATFASMSLYGHVTKRDLTRFGGFLFMGLVGIVIASLVNIFLHSDTIYWVTTYAGVFVFVGLSAYDTQRIQRMAEDAGRGGDAEGKVAVLGALTLYLDFVNLFLMLLRLIGRRRD